MTYAQGAAARAAWHRGKLHARRGLSDKQVTELRRRAAEGPAALAKELGVNYETVRSILRGKSRAGT